MRKLTHHLHRASVVFMLVAITSSNVLPVLAANQEIVPDRTYSSKTYAIGDQKQAVFHQKWIHYLDEKGVWQDIKTTLKDTGNSFSVDTAPFSFSAPKTAGGVAPSVLPIGMIFLMIK